MWMLTMLSKPELPIPCESSVCTAASTETDVLDLPGYGAPVLAANFTGDSTLASPTKWMSSLLVAVLLGQDQQVHTLVGLHPVESDLKKEARPTILLSLKLLFHVALSCEGRGSDSVI